MLLALTERLVIDYDLVLLIHRCYACIALDYSLCGGHFRQLIARIRLLIKSRRLLRPVNICPTVMAIN